MDAGGGRLHTADQHPAGEYTVVLDQPHQPPKTPIQAALHTTAVARQETPVPDQSQPSIEPVPKVAKILGFAGAIPFLALTPQVVHSIVLLPDAWVANAGLLQITYGVGIASFLGGIHWAMAMAEYGGAVVGHQLTMPILNCPNRPCIEPRHRK